MKNKYSSTAAGLYFNYIIHGASTIILAQNTEFLSGKWGVDKSVVLWVISALGLGRIFFMVFSGILSDRFGRKPFVLLGIKAYILFFLGILLSPTPTIGFIFAFIGGTANAFLDTGTYPALIEAFPKRSAIASMLVGFAVSWGQFLLPLLLALLISKDIWLGYSFIIPTLLIALNGIFIKTRKFPDLVYVTDKEENTDREDVSENINNKATKFDMIIFLLYGYSCQATSYVVINWLATYAVEMAGVTVASSKVTMSLYGLGAILCVPLTYKLEKYMKSYSSITLLYGIISVLAIVLLILFPTPLMCATFAMLIGIATEGGVMQLVLVIMTRFFPQTKGKCTGMYYTLAGLATFSIPIITGGLMGYGLKVIMLLDLIFAIISLILAIIIYKRCKVVLD
jgi:MFS family permease